MVIPFSQQIYQNPALLPLNYIMIISCIIENLSAFILLIYKRFHDNSPLWSERIFEPITGFLLWVILHSSFRASYLIISTFNFIPDAIILRSIINFAGWTLAQFAIATYIAGLFKAISKLTFHRPTACRQTDFILAHNSVLFLYWTFIIIVGTIIFVLSLLRGYYQLINNNLIYKICQGGILITLCIANIACNICLFKYGRLLVVLTQESVKLTNGRNETYKAYLNKLKTLNFAFMVIVSWSSISFLAWAVGSITMKVKDPNFVSVMIFITNTGYAIMIMIAIISVIRGELSPKGIEDINDIELSSNVRWSQTSFGQATITMA